MCEVVGGSLAHTEAVVRCDAISPWGLDLELLKHLGVEQGEHHHLLQRADVVLQTANTVEPHLHTHTHTRYLSIGKITLHITYSTTKQPQTYGGVDVHGAYVLVLLIIVV